MTHDRYAAVAEFALAATRRVGEHGAAGQLHESPGGAWGASTLTLALS